MKNRIIISSRELEVFIQKTNEFLDDIIARLDGDNSAKQLFDIVNAVDAVNLSIRQLQARPEYRHAIPDEIEEKLVSVGQKLTHQSLGNDLNSWYELIRSGIDEFVSHFDPEYINQEIDANETDRLELRKTITRYTTAIEKTISDYEKKFGSTFDPALKDLYEKKKAELAKTFGIYIGQNEKPLGVPVDIQTIDPDKVLDLYEEIKNMPEGDERQEKIKQLERLQRIMKSSLKNIRLSKRD